jgi:predicted amidohydrolase
MDMSKNLLMALFQGDHGRGIPNKIKERVKRAVPDIFCLPEYFMVSPEADSILSSAAHHDEYLEYLKALSRELNCALAGPTLLFAAADGYYNICYFISNGKVLGQYRKIHPFKNEGGGRVLPGREYAVVSFNGIRVGLLICADVLYPESYLAIARLKPDLIIIPVTSPYHEGESVEQKHRRDNELFLTGARLANCPVVKVGSYGRIAGRPLQGRSLVATPEQIIYRVAPEDELKEAFKIIELSIELA